MYDSFNSISSDENKGIKPLASEDDQRRVQQRVLERARQNFIYRYQQYKFWRALDRSVELASALSYGCYDGDIGNF